MIARPLLALAASTIAVLLWAPAARADEPPPPAAVAVPAAAPPAAVIASPPAPPPPVTPAPKMDALMTTAVAVGGLGIVSAIVGGSILAGNAHSEAIDTAGVGMIFGGAGVVCVGVALGAIDLAVVRRRPPPPPVPAVSVGARSVALRWSF